MSGIATTGAAARMPSALEPGAMSSGGSGPAAVIQIHL